VETALVAARAAVGCATPLRLGERMSVPAARQALNGHSAIQTPAAAPNGLPASPAAVTTSAVAVTRKRHKNTPIGSSEGSPRTLPLGDRSREASRFLALADAQESIA
jgi:hypothetical protein